MAVIIKRIDDDVDVLIQDQTTDAFLTSMCQKVTGPYALATSPTIDSYELELVDATGLTADDDIAMFQNSDNPASFFAKILSISTNTLTLDTPIDIAYSTNAVLFEIDCDMAIDGSTTRQIFNITNGANTPIDVTRIILHITDNVVMDDGKFGGITALDKGCVLRKKYADGTYLNYFNVKTNGKIGELCYDKAYDAKAPAGEYGFRARLTFSGQEKIGVVIRLEKDEKLEWLVQDDLSDLLSFAITAEGHITDEV